MKQEEKLSIALSATRGEARSNKIEPSTLTAEEALKVLDDLQRKDPDLIASQWYNEASEHQIKEFKRRWNAWRRAERGI